MKKIIITLITACVLATVTGCLGTGDAPERSIGTDDAVIGRMAREIGTDEIAVLLNSPDDPENPGLPMSHLLTLIDRISLDKLIGIIQKSGARKTLDLIYAVKRFGCNRPVAEHPEGKFNIPSEDSYSDCSIADYDYLDVMVSLVNGTDNMDQLAMLINQAPYDTEEEPEDKELESLKYLEKLAYLVVNLENPEKMVALINGVTDPRDVVYFINQFDKNLELPVTTAEIIYGEKLAGTKAVLDLMKGVNDLSRLSGLMNGIPDLLLLVSLVNTVILPGDADTSDLAGFINSLNNNDISKTARILTDLNSEGDLLLAGLLTPYSSDASGGLGYAALAALISGLPGNTEAAKMASFLQQVNPEVNYMGAPISIREGMVRFVNAGGIYNSVNFPGLGSAHVALLISSSDAATLTALATMMNTTDIGSLVATVGCADRVSDPDFSVPCTACFMW